MLAAILFSAGILLYFQKKRLPVWSVLMGIGVLFKFSTGIFCIGFEVYLLLKRRWKEAIQAGIGIGMPFFCLNLYDHFSSLSGLLKSFEIQQHYSTWGQVIFKLFSTGMVFAFLASMWTLFHKRNDISCLFFCLPTSYLIYAVVVQDAFAMSYVMMQCLIFYSFMIAHFLRQNSYFGSSGIRKGVIYTLLFWYGVITTSITCHNIFYDTLGSSD